MRKFKSRLAILSTLTALLCSVLFICLSTSLEVFASVLNVKEETFFVVNYDGHSYKCYTFENDGDEPVDGVAIAWGEIPSNTPTSLSIPSSVTYNNETYPVRAIAKHAFRYCDFESITLPNTIEAIYEEAFAYCTKLQSFSIPYLVDKIYPSTFLDCRALEGIHYMDSSGNVAFGNNKITEIGDHAFDSCVSLRNFYCPTTVTKFGSSSFKNCSQLVNFYFPSKIMDGNTITNPLIVNSYAFADCSSLIYIYFETNMSEIDDYAFVDCNSSLRIKYTGNSIPSYSKSGSSQTHWRDCFIANGKTDKIPVDVNQAEIHSDPDYPCLRYSIENTVVKLESAQDKPTTVYVIDQAEINSEGAYAVIDKFDTPSVTVPGCFDIDTGALTIPNTLEGKKVKVISASCFANNTDIRSITFNQDLVQIRNKAFYNCPNIASINFQACQKLKEVSYQVFHDNTEGVQNELVTSLILPNCLEYIGCYGFCKFYNVNEFSLPNNIKAFDDLAFFRLGYNITNAQVDLLLPKSLNDASAQDAYFKHQKKGSFVHNDYTRFYAVGKYAFNEAKCIRTVTMEDDPDHANDNNYTCSFYSNVFNGATNLIRFKASKNLGYLGKDCFKTCTSMREIFLTTTKSEATGYDYPWCIDEEDGTYGGTLFWGGSQDLICYLDGSEAPGILETYTLATENTGKVQVNSMWNAETDTMYTNEAKSNSNLGRKTVPTYYNTDFSSVKYWNPKTNAIVAQPTTLADYNNGVVSFVKNSSNKYVAVRYYYSVDNKTGTALVDLTNVPGISDNTTKDLTTIGNECFGRSTVLNDTNDGKNKQPGLYFILPSTITEIGDRAFYRSTNGNKEPQKGNGRYGVRIVTYKNADGNVIAENGSAVSVATLQSTISSLEGSIDVNKRGFCVLPNGVTSIGKLAFYNNIFKTVRMGGNISYFGIGAFYSNPSNGDNVRSTITTYVMTNNSIFNLSSGGIYFVGGGNDKKMLVSQTNGNTGTLTIASGTKAIGMQGCANTKYSTINLPSGLTTIYGNGFAKNHLLTTVTGVSDLRYIGTMKNILGVDNGWDDPDYTEVWDETVEPYFDNVDFRGYAWPYKAPNEAATSAFYDCVKLETINFREMTKLRKIGYAGFNNCNVMKNMAGSTNYVYKEYKAGGSYTTITGRSANNQNVLDLTNCPELRSIGGQSFIACNNIKFAHIPSNRAGSSEAKIYVGYDPEKSGASSAIFSNNKDIRVLVSEIAEYANHDFGKGHNAQKHFAAGCFGTGNSIYYYVSSTSDIPTDDSTSLKYWTTNSSGEYILFNTAVLAREYYGA